MLVSFLGYLVISFDQKIEFFWNGIIFSSKASTIFFIIIIFSIILLILQRLYLYIKSSPARIKSKIKVEKISKRY